MSRFDYVKYDEHSQQVQAVAKDRVQAVEVVIDSIGSERARQKALDALEECYMWIGKGVRDDQCALRGAELQEGRGNE